MVMMKNMFARLKIDAQNGVYDSSGFGAPVSGTGSTATGLNVSGPGSRYIDLNTGVVYWNEGTAASPYWTPENYLHPQLLSWFTDFRDGVGVAVAATDATVTLAGSGIRLFGSGIEETDSGVTVAIGEDGPIASVIASAADAKLVAIGVGITTSVPFQPNTHGPLVIDVLVAMSSALTLRRFFCGFIGTAADALVSPATGSTTTITLVQDDLAGLFYDAALTAASRLFAPHNKSDEAATIATTATGVDTGVNFPAAGTYTRLRVEISAAGVMTCFIDKAQVTQISAALDVDEEVAPVLLVASTSAATKTMLVKRFATWGYRRSGNF